MSKIATLMQQAAAGAAGELLAIEDVFSTYLYLGNGSTQTIPNGIDLAGEGGLVWIKGRTAAQDNHLFDTNSGALKYLRSNRTNAQALQANSLTSFNANGFTLGNYSEVNTLYNGIYDYASWTFRKAPRFFDVVTYTGNGTTGKSLSHNLGVALGVVIIKKTSAAANWYVYHRDIGTGKYLQLNLTDAEVANSSYFVSASSTEFVLGSNGSVNGNGQSHVAYLFAHDPLGPSGDGSDGLIACGSYTGNGGFLDINLGWEPQWLLVKKTSSSGNWRIVDTMRGWVNSGGFVTSDQQLYPNLSDADTAYEVGHPTSTGWQEQAETTSGASYIYIAIRRGPMRQPESGTEVFAIGTKNGTSILPSWKSGFPTDFFIYRDVNSVNNYIFTSRLTAPKTLTPPTTSSEGTTNAFTFDHVNGVGDYITADATEYGWMFRRAPGFFDVVAYTGNGSQFLTVPHNLGVQPELIIIKRRSDTGNWPVAVKVGSFWKINGVEPDANGFCLNSSAGITVNASYNSVFTSDSIQVTYVNGNKVGDSLYASGVTYIMYLFATLPGVSKVGSYTGNGSSQTINCGFTGGARFVLIKRTNGTGDWYVWDTARGIVSGNDPHLSLNTTAAEVTTDDTIDPDSSGFIVNQVSATNVNVSSASYIFYAVA